MSSLRARILQGDPAETLCHLAEDADLLVVGARGRGTFATLPLGPVADKCADYSPGPVVIVPTGTNGQPRRGATRTGRIVVGACRLVERDRGAPNPRLQRG
ncbi:MAG: universal stress protein [Actinomycetota bacterium]|nr:universal stress protein [Actinomycetota bacterium]